MNKKIKLIFKTLLMIMALIFNAKGTYANSFIGDNIDEDLYLTMQVNEINEEIYNEKTRGQTMYEYLNSGVENMSKVDKDNLLFATRTYKVQDGIQNGFINFCERSGDNGAVQGLMKPTLVNGQAVFSSKLKNTYQIFPSANAITGENEIYKNIYTGLKLSVEENDGIFTVNKNGFYPNLEYDSYFTAKMETKFKMTSDGKSNGEDLYFEVAGSDDIYVYIDGKLIIDFGGTHGNMYAKANFVDKAVFYQGMYDESINDFDLGVIQSIEEIPEGEHTLSIFYARRGMEDNNFRLEYNLSRNPIETPKQNNINTDNNSTDNTQEKNNENEEINETEKNSNDTAANQEEEKIDLEENSEKENIIKENSNEEDEREEKQDEYSSNGSNDKNENDEKNSKDGNAKTEGKGITVQTKQRENSIKSNNLNQEEIKTKTNLKSMDAKSLKTIESTDVKNLNTQNVSTPNNENVQEDNLNRSLNLQEPITSKINFEDNSESLIIKQINKLSTIHTILIAIVIILQLAILIKK